MLASKKCTPVCGRVVPLQGPSVYIEGVRDRGIVVRSGGSSYTSGKKKSSGQAHHLIYPLSRASLLPLLSSPLLSSPPCSKLDARRPALSTRTRSAAAQRREASCSCASTGSRPARRRRRSPREVGNEQRLGSPARPGASPSRAGLPALLARQTRHVAAPPILEARCQHRGRVCTPRPSARLGHRAGLWAGPSVRACVARAWIRPASLAPPGACELIVSQQRQPHSEVRAPTLEVDGRSPWLCGARG